MKLSDLSPGDVIMLDDGFTCHHGGKATVQEDSHGLFFECAVGHHYLDGQVEDLDGELVGISPA